jgi:biotin transport system substrate-specific component
MTTSPSSRRSLGARDLALVASFAALIAALTIPGAIPVGGFPAPITLQTLGVMLAGSILGWKRGTLSVLLYLALGAVGLPVFAGGKGGLGAFVGPTSGYLFGFALGAAVIGWLVERRLPAYPTWWGAFANIVGGILAVYAVGIPVLAAAAGLPLATALKVGGLVFLPGDLVKVVIATVVAAAVHRAVPDVAGVASARQRHRVGAS